MNLPITGGCACGAIRYESSTEPLFMFFCRCIDCRRATGSAYAMNVIFPSPSVQVTTGEVTSYEVTAFSGQPARHNFCNQCGSPIGLDLDAYPDIQIMRSGSFDDPSHFKPTANLWMSNALPWDKHDESLLSCEKNISDEELAELMATLG